jgi:CheY-like chemotaxis protein
MNEEVRSHLFEPFFTTKKPGEGTGLGLATCYGIVTQANGEIVVASEPGRGASFTIYLPRAEAAAEPVSGRAESGASTAGHETVLLVEDEPVVRALAARVLRQLGYVVIEASSADGAIAIVKGSLGAKLDLLLTDVVMPGLRGTELVRRVRARRPSLKVLFMTGYADDFALRKEGVDVERWLLQKPFTPEVLAAKVREVLDAE